MSDARRLPALLLLAAAAACAHVEGPPGGPADVAAPRLELTRPDTFARVRSYLGPVVFSYDEGLSERGVDTLVSVSPRTSGVVVDKRGRVVRVELRRGWQSGRVYQVTVHPGLSDLFGNTTKQSSSVVFSTGPEIVHTVAQGTVVERTTLQRASAAVVEAIPLGDSLVYQTRPDSTGSYRLEYLPEGEYRVRAYNDTNRDQRLQDYEAFDTARVRVARGDTARVPRLAVLAPDTSAPRAGSASGERDLIEVKFDDFLDPAQPLSPAQVVVTGPNGPLAVAEVRVGPFPARPDSADGDSAVVASVRPDSGRAAAPTEPVPSQTLAVRTAVVMGPDVQLRVRVSGVRNLHGLVGGGEVPLRTPRAPAPAPAPAAARPAADSSARAPASAPPAPRPAPPAPPAPTPSAPPAGAPRPLALAARGPMIRDFTFASP